MNVLLIVAIVWIAFGFLGAVIDLEYHHKKRMLSPYRFGMDLIGMLFGPIFFFVACFLADAGSCDS